MKNKCWLVMLLSLLVFSEATAEEDLNEEVNAFGYPDKSLVAVIEAEESENAIGKAEDIPDCNDEKLIARLQQELLPLLDKGGDTIREKRKVDLTLKNIRNFTQLETANIDSDKDTIAADRIIELKVNQKLRNNDIKVCKADSKVIGLPIYVVMYYEQNILQAEVLNFTNKENPKFVFEKNDN